MRNAALLQHFRKKLGNINGNGTYKYRLSFGMSLFNLLHHCVIFFLLGHIYRVFQILTGNRTVGRNLDNVHSVNITEFFFLSKSGTGHTCFFRIFVKEVLESDGSKCLALPFYLYMFFCFNSLMQTVGIPPSRHDTSSKLIYDQHLVILYYVILISEHKVIGTKSQIHIVLDLQVFCICQVFDLEEFLYLFHTLLRQGHYFIFFIDDEITCFCDLFSHKGRHLGHFAAGFPALQLASDNICYFIQLGGFAALSGNNKRGPSFINENRVHLVNNGIVKIPLYQLFLVDHHVITQVIKAQFIIGHVGDIAIIHFPAGIVIHVVKDTAHLQS